MNSSGPPGAVGANQNKADMHGQPPGPDEGDVIARNVREQTGGRWIAWYGHHTRRFWAVPRMPHPWGGLAEGWDALSLLRRIGEVDAACHGGPVRRAHGVWRAAR